MPFYYNKFSEITNFASENSQKKIKIVAVSKNHEKSSVLEAIGKGVSIFGENRVQEAYNKFYDIKKIYKNIELHLTGPLQTNKVKFALDIFDVFQTLDREKIALEIHKHKDVYDKKKYFVQINTGYEESKSGISPEHSDEFINFCVNDLKMNIIGLMCIPPLIESPKKHFEILKKIAVKNNLLELSMGMSNDYKDGILSGATYVRVGTLLFGKRNA